MPNGLGPFLYENYFWPTRESKETCNLKETSESRQTILEFTYVVDNSRMRLL